MKTKQAKSFRTMGAFLWLAVVSWAIALGAKLFDLVVLAVAWGASPPASLERLPYGKDYPIDPGNFFQPLSAMILIGVVGALIAGWKQPARKLIIASAASLAVIWVFTPTVFWPMVVELWEIHRGRIIATDAHVITLVQHWFIWDTFREVVIAIGFITSVRALIYHQSAPRSSQT